MPTFGRTGLTLISSTGVGGLLIAESLKKFREFSAMHGKDVQAILPEELIELGLEFYATTRVSDALPATEDEFGDALLFQVGTREALPPYYGECFYFDLTRQFISQTGTDDDAMFQLSCQLQYQLTPTLRALGTITRWCGSPGNFAEFKSFILGSAALAAVAGKASNKIEFYFAGV